MPRPQWSTPRALRPQDAKCREFSTNSHIGLVFFLGRFEATWQPKIFRRIIFLVHFTKQGFVKHDKSWLVRMISTPPYTKKNWLLAFEPLQPCAIACASCSIGRLWLQQCTGIQQISMSTNKSLGVLPSKTIFTSKGIWISSHKKGPGSSYK